MERGGQWVKGKSCETFNPLGPWLATPDTIPDPQAVGLGLLLNGEVAQHGSTEDMIFSIAHLIWYLSQFMVLEPGDLINTGTPAGVGMGRRPQRYLRSGDVTELWGDGLGRQRQRFVDAPSPGASW
jgi:2-keto-4-pentenoate hydratase/2-oxohepta-3-ene-1,7-dioic acid hydratase in catechol pathway